MGTTSLHLVCSHQKTPREQRAPGAVWTVKGKSKGGCARACVLTRGSGHRAPLDKAGAGRHTRGARRRLKVENRHGNVSLLSD